MGLITGQGIGVGLVRMGANALNHEDPIKVAALRRAAWLLLWVLGGLAIIILVIFRRPISEWMLGGEEYANSAVLMGLALIFSLAAGVQTSTINAYHRVGALAKVALFNSVLGAGVSLTMVWLWHMQGIGPAIVMSMAINFAVSSYLLRQQVGPVAAHPESREVLKAAWQLLRFGGPYTASMLVGTGISLILPALILHTLGTESVGFYRAAVAVSVNYLGFLLIAMGQDYYPRVSAISERPAELIHLVNQQHRLVMLLGVPMILGTLALAPYLVLLVYSPQFLPTVDVLEWQLIGDLFKFSSFTLGFVILARNRSGTFFLAESSFGIATLVFSWLGMRWFGIAGLGIGYLAAYMVLYLVNWIIVRGDINLVWTSENKRMMLLALLAALAIRSLPFVGLANLRTPIALSFAFLAGLWCLYTIGNEMQGLKNVHAQGS